MLKLVTFSHGRRWDKAAKRLIAEASESGYFDLVEAHSLNTMIDRGLIDAKIMQFIKQHPKGAGYWIWKPILIQSELSKFTNENDVLLYMDAGFTINANNLSKERLSEYLAKTQEYGAFFFNIDLIDNHWTKNDLFSRLSTPTHHRESGQIVGGINFWTSRTPVLKLVKNWKEISIEEDFHYIDDSASVSPNCRTFQEHRHDQSILSSLVKIHGYPFLPDETFWPEKWFTSGIAYPFWATRHGSGISFAKIHSSDLLKLVILIQQISRLLYSKFKEKFQR